MKKYTRYLFVFILIFLTGGCENGSGSITVDFSKKVDIESQPSQETQESTLRVAVAAMISPKATLSYYQRILQYIGQGIGRNVHLVQRKTYAEINELLARGEIDVAFICSGPYATDRNRLGFEALATPVVRGEPFYRSYLLVNAQSNLQSLQDLEGKTFAFTDPDSNTGTLVPTYWLQKLGTTPEAFFSKTIYTYSHDNSILAVARQLVEGATVDGHIWEYYQATSPEHTSRTRVIHKSKPFGNPPVVASNHFPAPLRNVVKELLLSMHEDPEGAAILHELMIDGFVTPRPEWYASIKDMAEALEHHAPTSP